MSSQRPSEKLVEFLVRQADRATGDDTSGAMPDWLDDNFWARLADRLITPDEQRQLAEFLATSPAVRRRAAAVVNEWPTANPAAEADRAARVRPERRRRIYALAAMVLAATGAVIAVWSWRGLRPEAGGEPPGLVAARESLERGQFSDARTLARGALSDVAMTPAIRRQARSLIAQTYCRQGRRLLRQGAYASAEAEATAGIDAGYASVGLYHVLACSRLREPVVLVLNETGAVGPAGVVTRELPATAPAVDYDRAIGAVEKAVGLDPKDANARNMLGLVQFARGDYGQAVRSFEAALALAPGTAVLHHNLGRAYENWEDDQGNQKLGLSVAHYERFLKLSPMSPLAPGVRRLVSEMRAGGVKPARLD